MVMSIHKNVLVTKVEKELEYYDKVFLVWQRDEVQKDLFIRFYNSDVLKNTKKKVLFLSTEGLVKEKKYAYRIVTEQEAVLLRDIYYMYEFSDRFLVFSQENEVVGNILNFAETGILTMDEVFEAMLL